VNPGAAPGTQILPVQVLCSDGTGLTSDVASGIVWEVDHGDKSVGLRTPLAPGS
jgi:subtilisin family serine protease